MICIETGFVLFTVLEAKACCVLKPGARSNLYRSRRATDGCKSSSSKNDERERSAQGTVSSVTALGAVCRVHPPRFQRRVRWCSGGDAGPSEAERSCWPKFTLHEIAKHASLNDAWIVVFDRVFDITSFAITHPGFHNAGQVSTALAITRTLGTECSDEFASLHSPKAWAQLHDFQVGVVFREGDALDTVDVAPPALPMMRKWKEKTRGHVPETLGPAPETLNPTKREDTGYTVPRRDHRPTPTWLTSDRNFWKRFGAGVDDNVLRYLTKQGYKQSGGGG